MADISWSLTPSDSRAIQSLVNLTVGTTAGVALALVLNVVLAFRLLARHGISTWVVGFLVLFLVIAARRSMFFVQVAHNTSERTDTVDSEWWDAVRWSWVTIVAFPIAAMFVALGHRYGYWIAPRMRLLHLGGFGIALVVLSVTHAAFADGTIDRAERTLTYKTPDRSEHEIDLDYLSTVRTFSFGSLTVVWLSFPAGTVSSTTPRIIVLPTEIVTDAVQVLEQGVAHKLPDEPDLRVRRQLFIGAAILLGSAGILLGLIIVGTDIVWFGLIMAGIFGIPGFIVLFLAFRS